MNTADDTVLISALQHYIFCPRQFAIIHADRFWQENFLTADGRRLHDRVDLPGNHRSKSNRVEYALCLISEKYALSGKADAVEFLADGTVIPIEYKRGSEKPDNRDKVQLCAQALCLEEMMNIQITEGALFYFETRNRIQIPLNDTLRTETIEVIHSCRSILSGEIILPKAIRKKCCGSCSLVEYCMPMKTPCSAQDFLNQEIQECENY